MVEKSFIDRLHKDITAALNAPDVREQLLANGIESAVSTPAEFTAYIQSETVKWEKVIRAANLKAN